jgi:hypothetical protein
MAVLRQLVTPLSHRMPVHDRDRVIGPVPEVAFP